MKVSLSWLRDFVEIEVSAQELADRLTMAGFEVESMESARGDVDRLVVARVVDARPHPNADKLKVCLVDTGREKVDVVCGAPNVAAGQFTVYAPPETVLPDGQKIERAAIRGVMSAGMLCSLAELGLEEKSPGIHLFDKSIKIGTPVAPLLALDDVTYDLNITPNRPDALSIIGIAREVAALLGKPLEKPDLDVPEGKHRAEELASVEIADFSGCPRYVARLIEGIKIGASPFWIQARLKACGQRPINNIVDVTNYVMIEMGQPLHAFDLNVLANRKIVVRRAREGEIFTTLDGSDRKMTPADLMICDGRESVAVAGVMGGLHSEVTGNTKDVLLESACFNPGSIRATSKRLGLSTEASYRFERGVDPDLQLRACTRAITLMAELAGGAVAQGAIDIKTDIPAPAPVLARDKRVNLFLGVDLPRARTKALLESLELGVSDAPDGLLVSPPTFRADLKEEADIIEEVARMYGYDRIPVTLPESRVQPVAVSPTDAMIARIREVLTGAGFFEAITLSLMNPDAPDWLRIPQDDRRRKAVKLLNPLSAPEGVLRTSLLPGIIGTVAYNLNRFQKDPRLFEVGRVFLSKGENDLPDEPMELAGAYSPSGGKSLYSTGAHPFYVMKGAVDELLDACKIPGEWKQAGDVPYLLPGEAASVHAGGKRLGLAGRVRPSVAKKFDVDEPLYVFEVDFMALLDLFSDVIRFAPLPVYPPAFRDIAVLVDDILEVWVIEAVIRREEAVSEVRLFDVYRGKPVPEGKKSVALAITYRFKDRSPSDEEVNAIHTKVTESLKAAFGAEIR